MNFCTQGSYVFSIVWQCCVTVIHVPWRSGVGGEAEEVKENIEEDPRKDPQMQII